MANNIQNRIRQEMEIMARLYEVTEGSEVISVNLRQLGEELGLSSSEIDELNEFLSKSNFIKRDAETGAVCLTPQGAIETKYVAVIKLMGDLRRQLPKLGLDSHAYHEVARDIQGIEGETKGYGADFAVVQMHLSSTRTVLEELADSPTAVSLIQQIDALQKRIGA